MQSVLFISVSMVSNKNYQTFQLHKIVQDSPDKISVIRYWNSNIAPHTVTATSSRRPRDFQHLTLLSLLDGFSSDPLHHRGRSAVPGGLQRTGRPQGLVWTAPLLYLLLLLAQDLLLAVLLATATSTRPFRTRHISHAPLKSSSSPCALVSVLLMGK